MAKAKEVKETKKCKKCMEEINKKAKRCPKCGANLGMPGWLKFLIVIGVVIVMCVSCMSSCADSVSDAMEETEKEYLDINGKTSFKVGDTFQNKFLKVSMTEVNDNFKKYSEYATVRSGYKVVMVKFDAENIGESDQYVSYLDFDCYADDVAVEYFYSVDDDKYPSLSATLSKGKKTSGYAFYEVPKDAKKIVLEYDASWLEDTNIEFIIK